MREDPTFHRTNGEIYGRDGCRVPIPWETAGPAFGFSGSGESWLAQPTSFAHFARDLQQGDPASTLALYRAALALRAEQVLGTGSVLWLDGYGHNGVALRNDTIAVIANIGDAPVTLPAGEVPIVSGPLAARALPRDTAVWIA